MALISYDATLYDEAQLTLVNDAVEIWVYTEIESEIWVAELGNPYDAVGGDDGRVSIEWGVYGVPETFVVDKRGRVRYRHVGALTPDVWQRKIGPLMEELKRES